MITRCERCKRMRKHAARGLCASCYSAARAEGSLHYYEPRPRRFFYRDIAARLGISEETLRAHRRSGRVQIAPDGTVLRWGGQMPRGPQAKPRPAKAARLVGGVPCRECGRPVASRARGVCRRCEAAKLFEGVVFDGVRYAKAD